MKRGMTKVAKPISVPSSSHQLCSGPSKTGSMARKKTPSELRVSYQTLDLNLAFNLCDYMEDASVIIVHY